MKSCVLLLAALMIIPFQPGYGDQGCFLVVAGKAATADGSVLLGHNEDNGIDKLARLRSVERKVHSRGETLKLAGGASIPQADTTFGYLILEMPGLAYSHGLLNEYGVAVVSNNCPSREDLGELTEGGIGPDLRFLVAERARTAREGVKLVGFLIKSYGYVASGRTLTIGDPQEAWQVAMVHGKLWVARRVPDDEVAVLANSYAIHEVALEDTLNYLGSPEIKAYATQRGWYTPLRGAFDFERAYARQDLLTDPNQRCRQWSGFNRVAASPLPLPDTGIALPFSVKPKKKLTPADLFGVLRDHYEDTPYSRGTLPPHGPPPPGGAATICNGATNHGDVFQLRDGLPVEIGALWWIALWRPCASPFLPLYYGISEVPEPLDFAVDPAVFSAPDKGVLPGPEKALRVFHDLTLQVDGSYYQRIGKVRQEWAGFDSWSLLLQPSLERLALESWKKDRPLAVELLDRYCAGTLTRALELARELEK
ncbi:MAG: hypothetical protein A3F83_04320 [Candidatus Glassbacteria bacterium RIFCSPLOWO2_12_FULL_58_11]|uniref:Dipeptidase n=1 Tax=Candidatus Glassbacteria bacterium RIFCSPLOWO2_12_FULL_58_11 TaxID=1817867 RepID=A0A1F5YSN8_9BACT|nr:MAG: hypothetical protein A3F83_04320 [Candidatus Glassbacteria bacterium RIFCSPLOWO2_12_FULL_58_11]